jgi:hypothetical protein
MNFIPVKVSTLYKNNYFENLAKLVSIAQSVIGQCEMNIKVWHMYHSQGGCVIAFSSLTHKACVKLLNAIKSKL